MANIGVLISAPLVAALAETCGSAARKGRGNCAQGSHASNAEAPARKFSDCCLAHRVSAFHAVFPLHAHHMNTLSVTVNFSHYPARRTVTLKTRKPIGKRQRHRPLGSNKRCTSCFGSKKQLPRARYMYPPLLRRPSSPTNTTSFLMKIHAKEAATTPLYSLHNVNVASLEELGIHEPWGSNFGHLFSAASAPVSCSA